MTGARVLIVVAIIGLAGEARAQDAGNPIASLPLSSLSATREKPLFSPSRRPPPAPAAIAQPETAAAPAAVAQAAEGPPFTLLGTLLGPEARIGIFINEQTRQSARIREGESDSGWTLVSLDSRSAVMRGAGQEVTLALPEKPTNAALALAAKVGLEPSPADFADPGAAPPPLPLKRRGFAK